MAGKNPQTVTSAPGKQPEKMVEELLRYFREIEYISNQNLLALMNKLTSHLHSTGFFF